MKIVSKIQKQENLQKIIIKTMSVFVCLDLLYRNSSSDIRYLEVVPWLPAESSPAQWLRDPFQNGCSNMSVQFSLLKSNKTLGKWCQSTAPQRDIRICFEPNNTTEQLILLFTCIWSNISLLISCLKSECG